MAYERRARVRVKWRIVIPACLLLAAILYMALNIFFPRQEDTEGVTICTWDARKTANLLEVEHENLYEISDYFFYGENLNLFQKEYDPENPDDLATKTLKLKSLCDGSNEVLIQLSNSLDRQIALGELEDGFYEVYVVNNLEDYRMTSTSAINEVFYTITRNDASKRITFIADNNYTEAETPLQQNYVYLNVETVEPQPDTVDIMLDPAGGNDDFGLGVDYGYEANGLLENDEMFKAAEILKEKLEAYGFTVGITKNTMDENINTSGFGGRLHKAYEKNAKLYLNLQFNMNQSVPEMSGMEITHSYYSSSALANQIIHDMEENTALSGSALYQGLQVNGVVTPQLYEGEDGLMIYDGEMQIRESGGMGTMAGQYSTSMRELNGSFALDNRYGMQALIIRFCYISNPGDVALWQNDQDAILQSLADSIAAYLHVTKE